MFSLPEAPGETVFVGLIFASWLCIYFLTPRADIWRTAIAALTCLVVVILLTGGRLPQRVLLPVALIMLAAGIVGALAFLAKQDSSSASAPTRISRYTTSVLVVAVASTVLTISANQLAQRETPTLRNHLELPDNVAVVAFWEFFSSEVFGTDATSVGSIPTKRLDRMLLLGWPQQSPNFINQQAVLGLGQNPLDPTSPTCIWVGIKKAQDLLLIEAYIREHYGEPVDFSKASGPYPDLWQMETSAVCPSPQ